MTITWKCISNDIHRKSSTLNVSTYFYSTKIVVCWPLICALYLYLYISDRLGVETYLKYKSTNWSQFKHLLSAIFFLLFQKSSQSFSKQIIWLIFRLRRRVSDNFPWVNLTNILWAELPPISSSQTTGDRTGLATGSSLYKKHVLRNWLVYVILSKTT